MKLNAGAIKATWNKPRVRRTGRVLLGLLAAGTLFLYFAGPPLLKSWLTNSLSQQLGRKLTVGAVQVNPLTLSVSIDDFMLAERDGTTPFVSFKQLHVNAQLASIAMGGPVLSEIRLTAPRVHLVRGKDEQYNFQDILDRFSKPPSANEKNAKEKQAESGKPPHFSLNNIQLIDGQLDFEDRLKGGVHDIRELNVAIPFLSNLFYRVDDYVEPKFSARVNGAELKLTGRSKPFESGHESSLELKLDNVDLAEYLPYVPKKLYFTLPSGTLDADLKMTFLLPKDKAPTLTLSGRAGLDNLALNEQKDRPTLRLKHLEVVLGAIEPLAKRHAVDQVTAEGLEVFVRRDRQGRLNLANLVEPDKSREPPPKVQLRELVLNNSTVHVNDEAGGLDLNGNIGRLALTGVAVQPEPQRIELGELSLNQGKFKLRRGKGEAGAPAPAAAADDGAKPWQYALKKLAVEETSLDVSDEAPAGGTAKLAVENIRFLLEGLVSDPGSKTSLSLAATVARTGSIELKGDLGLSPLSASMQLAVRGLPILPAQPYFADKLHVTLTRGTLNANGKIELQAGGKLSYAGDAQVNKFASVDQVNRNDFLKWETLHFGNVNVTTEPMTVAISSIALSQFYSRLVINPDGTLNVQHVMGKEAGSKQAAAGEVAEAAKPTAAAEPAQKVAESPKVPPLPIKIGRITLQGGQVNFSDNFIKPNYAANLTQIGGSVTGLSSDLATTAAVEVRGKVDDAAPVEILGKVNPLSGNLFLDIAASAKGVDLPAVTPYSARYAGYPITKGKLSMDVKYRIENRQLQAENRVVLDQLTFGDKVDSPTATKLPVLLAVALLKDRNGVIDINLPVSGSMDDPEFSVGGIVFKVIMNLLVKAVTSPFALLGSLFGGGEELSYIEFEPGRVALDKAGQDKLASLTKALEDRPALKLDITGRVDPEADKEGLRRVSIERKVKAVKFESLGKQGNGPASLDEVKVDPAEYPKLLKEAYGREKFPKPRNVIGLAKDLPVPEMEKLMLTYATVSDDDLRQLAIRRARTVADVITKTGKVGAERVFVLEPKLKGEVDEKGAAEKAKNSRVDFSLK